MRLSMVMFGGALGGRKLGYLVDTANTTPEVSQEISEAVQSTNFFNLPASTPEPVDGGGPVYDMEVDDNGRRHTIRFYEFSGSPARSLVTLASQYGQLVPASELINS